MTRLAPADGIGTQPPFTLVPPGGLKPFFLIPYVLCPACPPTPGALGRGVALLLAIETPAIAVFADISGLSKVGGKLTSGAASTGSASS